MDGKRKETGGRGSHSSHGRATLLVDATRRDTRRETVRVDFVVALIYF